MIHSTWNKFLFSFHDTHTGRSFDLHGTDTKIAVDVWEGTKRYTIFAADVPEGQYTETVVRAINKLRMHATTTAFDHKEWKTGTVPAVLKAFADYDNGVSDTIRL